MPLSVRFGIPQPTNRITVPTFKAEGVTTLSLNDFPDGIIPSGGSSGIISPSEMYMIQACAPVRMVWKDPRGKVMADVQGSYSFIGRFSWEIQQAGYYHTDIYYHDRYEGFVEYEVT